MRAAVHSAHGTPITIEDVEVRPPGPGEVLVRIDAAAVCLTDVMAASGVSMVELPFVGGHSGTGTVESVGEGVRTLRSGDRVVAAGSAECGTCYSCVRGTPSACDDIFAGMVPPIPIARRTDGSWVHGDGGLGLFTEQTVLRESVLAKIDADLRPEQAAMLGCGIIGGLGAVFNIGQVARGDTVAIVGSGHLGLWIVQAARLAGAGRIIVVEHRHGRRAAAGRLGATDLVDPAAGDVLEHVLELTSGRGVDVSFESGGTLDGIELGFGLSRNGGTVVLTSMGGLDDYVRFPVIPLTVTGRRVLSSQSGGGHLKRDLPRYARMLEAGQISSDEILTRTFPLGHINAAFDAARDKEVLTGVILPQR